MNNRRVARVIAVILAVVMALSILYSIVGSLTASATVTQTQIDKLRDQKKELEKKKQEAQSEINTIDFERKTEVAKKNVLDQRIDLTEQEIEKIIEIIDTYVVLIAEKELGVIEAQRTEDEHLQEYKKCVRNMEENGVITYLEVIFDSSSFSELLARIDFVGDIMKADEATYRSLIAAREATIAAKELLEQTKLEMEEEKLRLEEKRVELAGQLESAIALIAQIEADLEEANKLYQQVREEEEKIQKEINDKVEQLRKQEAARQASAAKGTGSFDWPAPGYNRVTSPYGNRLHPVYKVYRMHQGIDISAPHGANIIAADTGTVITSEYNSSYGNYVVISHGNGMTTLYAHMSSRKVQVGQKVEKRDVVGLVGSTGVSTGPHLHFEISQNGSRINPLNKFSGWVQGW